MILFFKNFENKLFFPLFQTFIILFFFLSSSCKNNGKLETIESKVKKEEFLTPEDKPEDKLKDIAGTQLWCRYRDEYGRMFETVGLDENGNKIQYTSGTNPNQFFWECPDKLYPESGSQECPHFLADKKTKIFSNLFLMVNDTPPTTQVLPTTQPPVTAQLNPHIDRAQFENKNLSSCQQYTKPDDKIYSEFIFKSENDEQPYLEHKPFFTYTPSKFAANILPFSRIVVFGDSVSDTGNFWSQTEHETVGWPYFMGRFSNGLVWIEHLVQKINDIQNNISKVDLYNYSTSGTGSEKVGYDYNFTHLDKQVDRYLSTMNENEKTITNWQTGYDKTLYVMFVGIDDYYVLSNPNIEEGVSYCGSNLSFQDPLVPNICAKAIIYGNKSKSGRYAELGIKGNIKKIIQQSGNAKDLYFLIPNMPNLTSLPYYNFSHIPPEAPILSIAFVNLAYKTHNFLLKKALFELKNEFKNKKLHFITLDMQEIFYELTSKGNIKDFFMRKEANITNQADSCYPGDAMINNKTFDFCIDPESYVFWDNIHPSMTTHCIMAENAVEQLFKQLTTGVKYKPNFTSCHRSYIKYPIQFNST